VNGFWGGAGILLGIAFFFAFANVASRMAQGVPRPRANLNALIAAAAFGLFSYSTHTGYHTVDADPLTGATGRLWKMIHQSTRRQSWIQLLRFS